MQSVIQVQSKYRLKMAPLSRGGVAGYSEYCQKTKAGIVRHQTVRFKVVDVEGNQFASSTDYNPKDWIYEVVCPRAYQPFAVKDLRRVGYKELKDVRQA